MSALTTICKEVDNQQAGPMAVVDLCKALSYGHSIVDPDEYELTVEMVKEIGFLVDKRNNGFRLTPVTFANGSQAASSHDIKRLMSKWVDNYNNEAQQETLDRSRLIKEFLWIHPFKDGNGRTAFVLHNMLSTHGMRIAVDDEKLCSYLRPVPEFEWH